jgi:general stress protein 26
VTNQQLFAFIRSHDLAVLATISPAGTPQAALVGIAVTPELELIFDTVKSSRKYDNLVRNSAIAFVIGCTTEITVQYEGEAGEPTGAELQRYKDVYFSKWPDCREHEKWPGIVYFKVRPRWIRYSDFNPNSQAIIERTF